VFLIGSVGGRPGPKAASPGGRPRGPWGPRAFRGRKAGRFQVLGHTMERGPGGRSPKLHKNDERRLSGCVHTGTFRQVTKNNPGGRRETSARFCTAQGARGDRPPCCRVRLVGGTVHPAEGRGKRGKPAGQGGTRVGFGPGGARPGSSRSPGPRETHKIWAVDGAGRRRWAGRSGQGPAGGRRGGSGRS